jgi:hypothetical protein
MMPSHRIAGAHGYGALQKCAGFTRVSAAQGRQSQHVEGFDILGVSIQYLPIGSFGLPDSTFA